jgi:hypothetical protein
MAKIFSSRKFMMIVSVISLVCMASTHFVKKIVVVKIHLCRPMEFGLISLMKSNPCY